MAVSINTYYSNKLIKGAKPSNPSFPVGETPPVLNPDGLDFGTFLTLLDTPSSYASQSLKGVRVNSGETALEFYTISSTDVLGAVLTGYTVGANTALASSDTVLGAFQKIQGQINAKISIANTQVAFGTGANTIGGSANFTFNSTSNLLTLAGGISLTGAQTIRTSTGVLTITSLAGNGNISLIPHNTGNAHVKTLYGQLEFNSLSSVTNYLESFNNNRSAKANLSLYTRAISIFTAPSGGSYVERITIPEGGNVLIGTTTDSGEKLNVNGTVRVQSITNATGNIATYSATGVLQQRTAAQILGDIGAEATIAGTLTNGYVATIVAGVPTWAASSGSSKWTDVGTGNIYRNSSVSIGQTADPTESIDVSGSVRLRTVSNATGDFARVSATGVITKRTTSETKVDLGATTYASPSLTMTDLGGGATYSFVSSPVWYIYYSVIGNYVFITATIPISSVTGTPSGGLRISGLPFTIVGDFPMSYNWLDCKGINTINPNDYYIKHPSGSSYVEFYKITDGTIMAAPTFTGSDKDFSFTLMVNHSNITMI